MTDWEVTVPVSKRSLHTTCQQVQGCVRLAGVLSARHASPVQSGVTRHCGGHMWYAVFWERDDKWRAVVGGY